MPIGWTPPAEVGQHVTETVGPSFEYYGTYRYWNELPAVNQQLGRLATGSSDDWWTRYVKRNYCPQPRKHGLVIGCGNGWVERSLIDEGIAEKFDAFDVDPHYVEAARNDKGDRDISYFVSDFKSFRSTPDRQYDIIINFAALHHAAYLYRHVHELANSLTPDGIIVNWEYVGTDRNQYSEKHLDRLSRYNGSMPQRFRTPWPLRPNLHMALVADPSEAVHASEIVRALQNEFDVVRYRPLGLAYPLLWNNIDEFEKDDPQARAVLSALLAEDERATYAREIPTLFAFVIAKPRTGRRQVRAVIDLHVREPLRESIAERFDNAYPREVLATAKRHKLWRPSALVRYAREYRARSAAGK